MIVTCKDCGVAYEDVNHWTICPHEFFAPPGLNEETREIQRKIDEEMRAHPQVGMRIREGEYLKVQVDFTGATDGDRDQGELFIREITRRQREEGGEHSINRDLLEKIVLETAFKYGGIVTRLPGAIEVAFRPKSRSELALEQAAREASEKRDS